MPARNRSIENCQFHQAVAPDIDRCKLLQELTGVDDPELCNVPTGACQACCECYPPSVTDPNPIVASLLYQLGENIIARHGTAGCTVEKAAELCELAMECLPKTAPRESKDEITAIPDYNQPSSQRSLDDLIPTNPPVAPIHTWAAGVTTAPRRLATVDDCLDSVINAGWTSPRIFSDSHVPLAVRHAHLPHTLREPQVGAWANFYLSLAELLMREPEADAYLMIQDDALFFNHTGLKRYLERALWQTKEPGIASLFCPRDYTQPEHGWFDFEGNWVWGAQAFVFSRSAAQLFLADREVVLHRWDVAYEGLFGIDVLIGRWAVRCGIPIRFPTPSLVQHIGYVSAIWTRAHISGARRADRFAGDLELED